MQYCVLKKNKEETARLREETGFYFGFAKLLCKTIEGFCCPLVDTTNTAAPGTFQVTNLQWNSILNMGLFLMFSVCSMNYRVLTVYVHQMKTVYFLSCLHFTSHAKHAHQEVIKSTRWLSKMKVSYFIVLDVSPSSISNEYFWLKIQHSFVKSQMYLQ